MTGNQLGSLREFILIQLWKHGPINFGRQRKSDALTDSFAKIIDKTTMGKEKGSECWISESIKDRAFEDTYTISKELGW